MRKIVTKSRKPGQESDLLNKLGGPAQRALANAGIKSLKQLAGFSEDQVKQLHGIGPNALKQLRQALRAKGLSFARKKSIDR